MLSQHGYETCSILTRNLSGEIMQELSLVRIQCRFRKESLKQRKFTIETSRYENIDQVLKLIEETHVVKCRKARGKPYISSNLKIKNRTCWQHVPSL